jgi:hypothetical protein
MNHWNLFKESWRIFWRHPALWLFGLLAALGGGLNLRYNFNFNFSPNNFDPNLFNRYFNLYGQRLSELPPGSERCSIKSSTARRLAPW